MNDAEAYYELLGRALMLGGKLPVPGSVAPSVQAYRGTPINTGPLEAGLEDPWIDPVSAATGGFAGKMMATKGLPMLQRLAQSGVSAGVGAAADYPIGVATEHIGEKYPKAALPFNVLAGMGSGMTLERMAEDALRNPQTVRNLLSNMSG